MATEESGAGPSGKTAAGGGLRVMLSHRWLPVILLLVLAPWALTVWMMVWQSQDKPAEGPGPAAVTPATSEQMPIKGKPGPWGNVEYVPITIAPPPEFLQELSPTAINNKWHFPGNAVEQVKAYFQSLALTDEQRSRLLARLVAAPEINGYVLTPEPEVVRTLSPEVRGRLYRTLAGSDLNTDQVNAFRVPRVEFQQRLAALSGLKLDMNLFRDLFYEKGEYKFFADLPLILPQIPQTDDRVLLVQTLTEQTTFLARLRVKENSNIDDLENYWGRGGRSKDIGPLLQSLARIRGGQTIDVIHLLPSFARRRIYSFPRPTTAANAVAYDCHWTSLNFFSDQPDDRFLDKKFVKETLKNDYYPIYGNPLLGDLVLLVSGSNSIIHTAVYVADNFVFTKNGSRYTSPWIFMRVEDVKAYYPEEETVTVSYARRKDL
jgi:hypothetical protein